MDFEASLMHDRESTQSTPRWVMAIGIMVIALLLVFVGLHLIGMSLLGHVSGGRGDYGPPPSATEHGMQQP
jgi:hypothetical protein